MPHARIRNEHRIPAPPGRQRNGLREPLKISRMADTGIVVVGAGVVGLAVAARLAPEHPGLVILERDPRHGMETSSRNSQVIHAGLYYPRGSLKAALCVEGRDRLYAFCRNHDVPHARIG